MFIVCVERGKKTSNSSSFTLIVNMPETYKIRKNKPIRAEKPQSVKDFRLIATILKTAKYSTQLSYSVFISLLATKPSRPSGKYGNCCQNFYYKVR